MVISTIIPTYNRTRLLMDRALPSVLAQGPDVEAIVVGDGTEPATARAIRRLGDPRVRYWNRPRPAYPDDPADRWRIAGLEAITFGLERAIGEWVSILADDDEYLPRHHERLLEGVAPGIDIVYGQSIRWRTRKVPDRPPIWFWQVYGERWPPDARDICQGAYIIRRAKVPRVHPSECGTEPWDEVWWTRLIGTATFRQVHADVHRYHPEPATVLFHDT
jgi:glycosyltransferase involved in cell wall biosynthesis